MMFGCLLQLIQHADDMQHDDYKERAMARFKKKLIASGVLFAIVIVLCLLLRIIN